MDGDERDTLNTCACVYISDMSYMKSMHIWSDGELEWWWCWNLICENTYGYTLYRFPKCFVMFVNFRNQTHTQTELTTNDIILRSRPINWPIVRYDKSNYEFSPENSLTISITNGWAVGPHCSPCKVLLTSNRQSNLNWYDDNLLLHWP